MSQQSQPAFRKPREHKKTNFSTVLVVRGEKHQQYKNNIPVVQISQQHVKSCKRFKKCVVLVDETNIIRQKLTPATSAGCSTSKPVLLTEHKPKLANGVPIVVEACLRYLEANATNCVGIFRVPGQYHRVSTMWNYMQDNASDRASISCISDFMRRNPEFTEHDVASFLKRFISSMFGNEPVIMYSCNEPLVALIHSKCTPDLIGNNCRRILGQLLVPARRLLLARLCNFLRDFSKHEKTTQMNCASLAVCFPMLMEPPPQDNGDCAQKHNKSAFKKKKEYDMSALENSALMRAQQTKRCISVISVLIEQSQHVFRRQGCSLTP